MPIKLTISYLMQTVIALITFIALLTIHLRKAHKKPPRGSRLDESTVKDSGSSVETSAAGQNQTSLILHLTSEFHKLQCYYSLVLQTAALIVLYTNNTPSVRNTTDETFLLLISANGLIPVSLTFYALSLFHHAVTIYIVVLTTTSALLASVTGFHIVADYSAVDGKVLVGGTWPAACGRLSPEKVCGWSETLLYHRWPNGFFLACGVACDGIILALMVWYLLKGRHDQKHRASSSSSSSFSSSSLTISISTKERGQRAIRRWMSISTHTAAITILLFFTAIEFFFFKLVLVEHTNIVDRGNWSFGQIVGIATWSAVIVDFVRLEIGMFCLFSPPPSPQA